MSYHSEALKIFEALNAVKDSLVGRTNFTLGDISIQIEGKDGIGGLIEEWFGYWAEQNDFNVRNPKKDGSSQEFPDYYIWEESNEDEALLEVKTYDADASANFDIANFQSYCASVAENPYRLDADYLIFSYKIHNGILHIHNIYLKKIWEITCPSERWPLKTQTKRGVIYNIRPSSFHSTRGRYQSFRSKGEFIEALFSTEEEYLNEFPSFNRTRYQENTRY
ncbi:NgoBV family restriction endonuclease [Acinetobacter junii]